MLIEKNNLPVKCKLIKIANQRGYPKFHFEINGKIYFYGLRGIRADYKIVLVCTNASCRKSSSILGTEFLQELIEDNPIKTLFPKFFLDISDPRIYDITYYDENSLSVFGSHKCPGTEIDVYVKSKHFLTK